MREKIEDLVRKTFEENEVKANDGTIVWMVGELDRLFIRELDSILDEYKTSVIKYLKKM